MLKWSKRIGYVLSVTLAIYLGYKYIQYFSIMFGHEGFRIIKGKPAIVHPFPVGDVYPLRSADAATFKVLDSAEDARAIYAVDANRVYLGYRHQYMPIDLADPATFTILSEDGQYTADKDRVYWYGVELEGADPTSFRVLKAPYAVDANRVYVGISPLAVHSLENFEVLRVQGVTSPVTNTSPRGLLKEKDPSKAYVNGWSRDGIAYYWGGTELEDADYDSLAILNDLHAKDKHTVYFRGKPIRGADAESFVIVGPGSISGRDKNFEYDLGKRVGPRKQ